MEEIILQDTDVTGEIVRSLTDEIIELVHAGQPFTDINLTADEFMMIRTPGGWVRVGETPVPEEDLKGLLSTLDHKWDSKIRDGAIDIPISLENVRLRCNIYNVNGRRNVALSVRVLPKAPPAIDKTGLPPQITQIINKQSGLVLITGPTGSGKTTTVASFLDHINRNRQAHIITIEQPIEYEHPRVKSIFSQKEVPTDVATFAQGLREAVREKPDVIMIGEVRDRETAETMLQAAESGHLVFATLHTNTADGAISKLLSFFEGQGEEKRQMIAQTLIAVICQGLLSHASGQKLVLAYEILVNTHQIAKAIAEPGRLIHLRDLMRQARMGEGEARISCLMNDVLLQLLKTKEVHLADAMKASNAPAELQANYRP